MRTRVRWGRALAVLLAAMAWSVGAGAQTQFLGRIDLTVKDSTGAVLPGVRVQLSGPQNASAVTDQQGEAHFLNLAPGTYTVEATLQGFTAYLNRSVAVVAGGGVPLAIALSPAGLTEQVNVAAESPQVDIKRTAVGTNVGLEELQNLPNARDPWVVMQTVPTVMVDRVNVGGSESGQQSNYYAKGADGTENTWNIDGIPITDMGALGSSPTYYDFDMFREMNVTTGGADVQSTTPGVQLNFVVKSGSNTPHGSARFFYETEALQSDNLPSELTELAGSTGKGNRTDDYKDRGFELGGPLFRDRLWAWGAIGQTDVDILTLNGVHDRTKLENYAFKAQAQLGNLRPEFLYFNGNKIKSGRAASPTRPQETTWNQDGPTDVFKGQVSYIIGNNLFLTGRAAHVRSKFVLDPIGGIDTPAFRDNGNVWHGSYLYYSTKRPQTAAMADANWFRGRHEVKFGFSWRKAQVDSISEWPGGDDIVTIHRGSYPTTGAVLAQVTRPYEIHTDGQYLGFYVGDTITFDRLTINAALRYDDSRASALETTQRDSALPDFLPGITAPAVKDAITWSLPSPRVGATYALDESRRTVARASYAMFSSQLAAGGSQSSVAFVSAASYAYAVYFATDRDRNGYIDPTELPGSELFFTVGFDPEHPEDVRSFNQVSPDLKSPRTHEVVVGLDRELMPNLAVSGSFTWRRYDDVIWQPLIGVRRGDYVVDQTLTGDLSPLGPYSQPVYALKPDRLPLGAGREYTNREGYHQRYLGAEFQLVKRLSNRWSGRFAFSTNDHREYFDNPDTSIEDPTPRIDIASDTYGLLGLNRSGEQVIRSSSGSGKSDIYLVAPRYQYVANGYYEGPWGLNFGANLIVRQGYGQIFNSKDTETSDPAVGTKDVAVVPAADDFRLPTVKSLDVRVEKMFRVGRANVALDVDVFNLTNNSTILGREYDVNAVDDNGAPTFHRVREIMNPRIARLGARVTF